MKFKTFLGVVLVSGVCSMYGMDEGAKLVVAHQAMIKKELAPFVAQVNKLSAQVVALEDKNKKLEDLIEHSQKGLSNLSKNLSSESRDRRRDVQVINNILLPLSEYVSSKK